MLKLSNITAAALNRELFSCDSGVRRAQVLALAGQQR